MARKTTRGPGLLILLLLLALPTATAIEPLEPALGVEFDQVLINSQDWEDIYHGLLFARLTHKRADLIALPETATDVILALDKSLPRVLIIEPARQRQYLGVQRLVEAQGLTPVELPGTGDIGLRLARGLPFKQLLITDNRYPYNAISLAPYALQQQGFVLFSNTLSEEDLATLLDERQVPVTAYGILDASVQQALEPYDPTVIDEGGKFDNNIAVVERFMERSENNQVTLTNGEFLEESFINANEPVLFIGRSNVPAQVETFLAESDVEVAILVGNYLSDIASSLKNRLETRYGKTLYVVAKVGRTPRVMTQQFTTPVALEYIPLPIINPELAIVSVNYNRFSGQLEVTYDNPSLIPVFFAASFTLQNDDDSLAIGNEDPEIIAAGQQKTLLYDADIDPEGLEAQALILYGDYPKALENALRQSFGTIPVIDVPDYAELEITGLVYDRTDHAFYITLHNPGDVPTHVNVELVDIIVDGLPTTLGTRSTELIPPGATKQVYVRAKLSKLDILENEQVLVRAYYGQREQVLYKSTESTFAMRTRIIKGSYLVGGVAVAVLLVLLLLLLRRKRPYTCDRCGEEVRSARTPRRHHCGGRFRNP